ncbi:ATP-binding domain-containing protein [Streptomyces sp. NPDC093109]|uniref:HelD family protein n=1 Tax=Streptomyces sp. NPDC093109 TaxID=3154977 RepID=UPI00344C3CFA
MPPEPAAGPDPDRADALARELARELDRERAYHRTCRAALAGMASDAQDQVGTGENAFASGADAEVLGRHLRSRAKELRLDPDSPLFFGRLDFVPDGDGGDGNGDGDGDGDGDCGAGDHAGQSYHIGRRRISEHPASPPLVIDWRAPVSRAFYRASAHDPQGVAVRRRFGWAPGSAGEPEDLTGLEDEHLTAGTGAVNGATPAAGASLLTHEIERPRVGPMRDIAATIQPEQDALVRSGLDRSLCVQGAPGTGKTAVGLHRAAYLLYTYPQRVHRAGLLILGPNRAFLAHIAEVLPALGETGIRQSTVADEIARHPVGTEDSEAAATVKHDVRMAEVCRRALYGQVAAPTGPPIEPLTVPDGSYRWRVGADELAAIVDTVRAEAPPYAVGRERVRSRAVRAVRLQAERRGGPKPAAWARRIERSRAVGAYVDAVWPVARPEEVLAGVLADPGAVAGGVLTEEECRSIRRDVPGNGARTGPRGRPLRWSAADLVLLDELAGLIERPGGYGHIVIDEAQDLSPMECRAIARRADFGSLTVLGDLAQGTTPWAARSWPELLGHLGKPDAAVIPLTIVYRVPGAVVRLANRLLGSLDVDVPPARSLRGEGELTVRRADGGMAGEATAAVTASMTASMTASVTVAVTNAVTVAVREALAREGSIGVIADTAAVPGLRTALAAAGATPPGGRVTVLPATAAKGLEYDHVVLVEPAAIVAAEAHGRGRRRLYVALTRAVSRLDIVHSLPLPAELTG